MIEIKKSGNENDKRKLAITETNFQTPLRGSDIVIPDRMSSPNLARDISKALDADMNREFLIY